MNEVKAEQEGQVAIETVPAPEVCENDVEAAGRGMVLSSFLETQEYRRFAEFCEDCRHSHYIGICYGVPGVGKTCSARRYTKWEMIEPLLTNHGVVQPSLSPDNPRPRAAFYTPKVTVTPKQMEQDFTLLRWSLQVIGEAASKPLQETEMAVCVDLIDLLVIDEADRLKALALEVLRDVYDRSRMGVILVGMPGIEKRLARYPQLYSRVGFVHQFRALGVEEQRKVIVEQVEQLGRWRQAPFPLESDALAAIIRMTGGNLRQLQQLLKQIERIVQINPHVETVSKKVVDVAREQLVFGRA